MAVAIFLAILFLLLGAGVWIGLSLIGVAWIGMEMFTPRPAGDAMAVTVFGSLSSWTLTATRMWSVAPFLRPSRARALPPAPPSAR